MSIQKLTLSILAIAFVGISFSNTTQEKKYKTENVLVIVMDGPRYSETWGDPTHQYIPRMANDMAPEGVIYSGFRNNGPTYTCAGHTALTTGIYQNISNTGTQYPKNPSMFQYWLNKTGKARRAAYVISSKDKLGILSDTKDKKWRGKNRPYQSCGVDGLQSGYRTDQETYDESIKILETYHPNLTLINFRQPDSWGHAGNWEKYLATMKKSDEFIYQVFRFIQRNEHYKDKTTIFVTNDHGRHLDGRKDGFVSHGDNCEGCRKINCFAYGPDFKKGIIDDTPRELIDIPATICELLDFEMEGIKGKIMTELFVDYKPAKK